MPLPVPPLLVGYDDEWIAVPPSLLNLWEKAVLEPYAPRKDVVYHVIAPLLSDPFPSSFAPFSANFPPVLLHFSSLL